LTSIKAPCVSLS